MEELSTGYWFSGMGLLAVFGWVAMDLFTDLMPWHLIDTSHPGKKTAGIVLLVVLGGAWLVVYQDLMGFVWQGLKHLLLLDVQEMGL